MMLLKSSIILILCSALTLFALSINPTLEKSTFFIEPASSLSQELYQTRNGIVSHTRETVNKTIVVSRYFLINLPARDLFPVLTNTVSACETADIPVFQHLHHHVSTDSLVYFCAANSSLLLIDQSSYTVESEIPLNTNSNISWPLASLATDGMNIVVLAMDTLFSQSPKSSMLFAVNMQTRTLSAKTLFNQNLTSGEAVVAYATNKKGTYVATNRLDGDDSINTTVYSMIMIGSTYQLTPISTFVYSSEYLAYGLFITKLFCLGNYVVVNSHNQLYFVNQQGTIAKTSDVRTYKVGNDINSIFVPTFTSQFESNYLYALTVSGGKRYSVVDNMIVEKVIDDLFSSMQIAYGNATSGDLMFSTHQITRMFTVTDLQTLNTLYTVPYQYQDIMLTATTYTIVEFMDRKIYILDLKTDLLLAVYGPAKDSYYNKDQQMITYLSKLNTSACALTHIDLASAKIWTTLPLNSCGKIVSARITEKGNPEAVFSFSDHYLIISETYGQLTFNITPVSRIDYDLLNINFDDLSIYYLVSGNSYGHLNASYYTFDAQSKIFKLQSTQAISAANVNMFFPINSTINIALSPTSKNTSSLTLLNQLSDVFRANITHAYDLATSFQDSEGKQYVVLGNPYYSVEINPSPLLLSTDGNFVDLPGVRSNTVTAQAIGSKSFAVTDYLSKTFTLIRFYSVDSHIKVKQTSISI